jgi:hypothetical protein
MSDFLEEIDNPEEEDMVKTYLPPNEKDLVSVDELYQLILHGLGKVIADSFEDFAIYGKFPENIEHAEAIMTELDKNDDYISQICRTKLVTLAEEKAAFDGD